MHSDVADAVLTRLADGGADAGEMDDDDGDESVATARVVSWNSVDT